MRDDLIIRLAAEAAKGLADTHPFGECPYLVSSYNALLRAAKANHPSDPFLISLSEVEVKPSGDSISVAELRVLLGQLRIVLESLQGDEAPRGERWSPQAT